MFRQDRTLRLNVSGEEEKEFCIGPDRGGDIRELRPYFLLPVFPTDYAALSEDERQKIESDALDRIIRAAQDKHYTDVFILSHGWHRNFLGAVSAYDRIMSRFAILKNTGRLPIAPNFMPLFITIHWHSDPGENGWMDRAGRRAKSSFLQNVGQVFATSANAPEGTSLSRDFDFIFEFFSRISAPGKDALSGRIQNDACQMLRLLDVYDVRDAVVSPRRREELLAEKVSMAWACYFESRSNRLLVDQAELPRSAFLSPFEAAQTLFRLAFGILGIPLAIWLVRSVHARVRPYIGPVNPVLSEWIPTLLALVALSGLYLWAMGALARRKARMEASTGEVSDAPQRVKSPNKTARGIPIVSLAAWGYLQMMCTLPLLAYCFVTFLISPRWLRAPIFRLFDERMNAGTRKRVESGWIRGSGLLARLARWPVKLIESIVGSDSRIAALADTLDSQLAFWEMQHRGAEVGDRAGDMVATLIADAQLQSAKLHLIGHSFGGLVVANLARRLALNGTDCRIQSVSLVQAAMASNWFERETELKSSAAVVSCVYSRYDFANGAYYPLANQARVSAGFVGLMESGQFSPEPQGGYAMLVRPPCLEAQTPPSPGPRVVNFDASRLVYDGPAAIGGGHNDIFKDDVIHLLWSLVHLNTASDPCEVARRQEPFARDDVPQTMTVQMSK